MIRAAEFLDEADRLIESEGMQTEAARRRAISTAYYGLFHTFAEAGARIIVGASGPLQTQISRGFNHSTLRSVCERIWRQKLDPPWDRLFLAPISRELKLLASTTIELQGARTIADYDLSESISEQYTFERVRSARMAASTFASIHETEEARTFLVAVLFSERWGRRC